MGLEGKRVALLVADLYEDLEYWYPCYRLREEGAEVVTVGVRADVYASKRGLQARADRSIHDVKAADFDALVIPGGYAPDHMRRSPEMVSLVRAMHEQGKPVAAICHAAWMLASADILRGRKATSFFSIRDDVVHAGATWVDEEVVVDAKIITSRFPDDLPAFCKAIVAAMAG